MPLTGTMFSQLDSTKFLLRDGAGATIISGKKGLGTINVGLRPFEPRKLAKTPYNNWRKPLRMAIESALE